VVSPHSRDEPKKYPHLLEEWDYEKNGRIDPECISFGSSLRIFWKCEHGHSWSAAPSSRAKGTGCPYCAGIRLLTGFNDLATLRPDIANQWDYERNGDLKPEMVTTSYRKKKLWWICPENSDHRWETTVVSRTSGCGCIICADEQRKITKRQTYISRNGSFADNNPDLLNEWLYEKNNLIGVFPEDIPNNYRDKEVWWKCKTCKHVWQTKPANRAKGRGCPECYKRNKGTISRNSALNRNGSLAQNHPEIALFWDNDNNDGIRPEDVTSQCHNKVNWKCPNCGHQWPKPVYKMTLYPCCPNCRYSLNEENRPVLQYDLKMNLLARFDSAKKASEATGIERSYILSTVRHDIKSTLGFVFRYEDDTTDSDMYKPTTQPTPKVVLQFSTEGVFIQEWESISAAEKMFPKAKGKISTVCKGKRHTAGGYVWKYKEDNIL